MDILFVHSAGTQGPGEGSDQLLASLRDALDGRFTIRAPLMPEPDAPEAAKWSAALSDHLAALHGPFVAVGHSLGGSMLLQHGAVYGVPERLAGMICIAAPFWGMPDWDVPEFELPPDFAASLAGLPRLVFYQSSDDEVVDAAHLDRYAAELPRAEVRRVAGRGHGFAGVPVADIAADIRSIAELAADA